MVDEPKNDISYFAETHHEGESARFGIRQKDRLRHLLVLGKPSMGSSVLLERLVSEDLRLNNRFCFFDFNGQAIDKILKMVPRERMKDVTVLDFADDDCAAPLGMFEKVSEQERRIAVNFLLEVFRRIWKIDWSERLEYLLRNILFALLGRSGSTIGDLRKILIDESFRKVIVSESTDPTVKTFWAEEFGKYSDSPMKEVVSILLSRTDRLINNRFVKKILRADVGKNGENSRDIFSGDRIILLKMPYGTLGEASILVAAFLVHKIFFAPHIYSENSGRGAPRYIYLNDIENLASDSFNELLRSAPAKNLGFVLSSRYLSRLPKDIRSSILKSVGSVASFRTVSFETEAVKTIFSPKFSNEELDSLGLGEMVMTLMIDGIGSAPFLAKNMEGISVPEKHFYREIMEQSKKDCLDSATAEDARNFKKEESSPRAGRNNDVEREQQKPPVVVDEKKDTPRPQELPPGLASVNIVKEVPENVLKNVLAIRPDEISSGDVDKTEHP